MVHQYLRDQTRLDHAAVDQAFKAFDLTDRHDYGRLLSAHASVTPVVEDILEGVSTLPPWRPRSTLIFADLEGLQIVSPEPVSVDPITSEAALLGALYVLEGSRLGGKVLSGRVPTGLPVTYLSDGHLPGEWRQFLASLDEAARTRGSDWHEDLVRGARGVFVAFLRASRVG
jgi:heme oxygenase (biliverdin-IX-beta and delta-forming)